MKLPDVLRRDTSAALQKAREDLTRLATEIAELQRQRDAALADADDIDTVVSIDRQADEQGRRLRLLQDKISLLETKAAAEEEDRVEERYREAVRAVERALPARRKALLEFEEALRALTLATRKVCSVNVFADWPRDVLEIPPDAYLSSRNIADALCRFVGGLELIDRRTRREHNFLDAVLEGRIICVADLEEERHAALLHALHHAHDSIPVEDESEPQTDESEEAA
jgi:hypothetical protein